MKAVHLADASPSGSGSRSRRGRSFATRLLGLASILIASVATAGAGTAGPQLVYPRGIDVSARPPSGLYPGVDAGSCCWMARRAQLAVSVPPNANAMIITLFVPKYALVGTQMQTLTATIDSAGKQSVCCLGPGIHELAFAVPSSHANPMTISLQMSTTFVPARVGEGADQRQLSVLLRGIEWRNTFGNGLASTLLDPRLLAAFLILYAALFVCAVIGTFRRPIFGAVLLIGTSPFALYIPIDGTTLTLPKTTLVAVLLGLALRGVSGTLLRDRRLAWLLIAQVAFAAMVLLSLYHAAVGGPVWREFLKQLQYALTGVVAFLAFRADSPETRERWIRAALMATTAIVSLAALFQLRSGAPMGVYIAGEAFSRIAGPLEGPNQLGAFLGIALPVLLAFAISRTARLLDYAVLVLGCLAVLLTFSRGGVTALAVGLGLVLASFGADRLKKVAYRVVAVLFAATFLLAVLQFAGVGSPGLARIAFGGGSGAEGFNGGLGTRAQLWRGAYILWRSSPLLGVGAGNYELELAQTGAPGVRTHANSVYFQTLAEEGSLGFVALLGLAIASIRVLTGKGSSVLPTAMLAVIVALWFHQITDDVTFYPKVGILLWTMLGIGVAAAHTPD